MGYELDGCKALQLIVKYKLSLDTREKIKGLEVVKYVLEGGVVVG